MAEDAIIRVDNLSKRYLIGHQNGGGQETFREMIGRNVRGFARTAVDMVKGRQIVQGDEVEEFWALKDVSFEVRRGEVLGVIGRNGAGKSTLLKILSRITEPSMGRIEIDGRVASLLEVGTGFHPELSGRENIFLNGAILGMSQREIRAKFDEIVAFAEVERFLDTPVKRYSSGMYVRLAFAVAAHLEPEILVVDEVLAVGDAEFQKKCLGKMTEVASGGRTVLFVSHNIGAVESLCTSCIQLQRGQLVAIGPTQDVVMDYAERWRSGGQQAVSQRRIEDGLMLNEIELGQPIVRSGDSCEIRLIFEAQHAGLMTDLQLLIVSGLGARVASLDLREYGIMPFRFGPGRFTYTVKIASLPLVEGVYSLAMALGTTTYGGTLYDLQNLDVAPGPPTDNIPYPANVRGYVVLDAGATVAQT